MRTSSFWDYIHEMHTENLATVNYAQLLYDLALTPNPIEASYLQSLILDLYESWKQYQEIPPKPNQRKRTIMLLSHFAHRKVELDQKPHLMREMLSHFAHRKLELDQKPHLMREMAQRPD
jgi:hypothetical protein